MPRLVCLRKQEGGKKLFTLFHCLRELADFSLLPCAGNENCWALPREKSEDKCFLWDWQSRVQLSTAHQASNRLINSTNLRWVPDLLLLGEKLADVKLLQRACTKKSVKFPALPSLKILLKRQHFKSWSWCQVWSVFGSCSWEKGWKLGIMSPTCGICTLTKRCTLLWNGDLLVFPLPARTN